VIVNQVWAFIAAGQVPAVGNVRRSLAEMRSTRERLEVAEAICVQLAAEAPLERAWPPAGSCVAILADAAGSLGGASRDAQREAVVAAGARRGVDPQTAVVLAGGVGAVITQTTHMPAPPGPGLARYNALVGADLPAAVELFLARDQLRVAQANSDPDLPRLWVLANGLAHGVPPNVMRVLPARSIGPAAKVVPLHDDLVAWAGVGAAVTQLQATVAAAGEGRRWLDRTAHLSGDQAALAAGVVALASPAAAVVLVRGGLGQVNLERARVLAAPEPRGVLDLSDRALKAVCDRNRWLLGAASERTQRELVQRQLTGEGVGQELRPALADGDHSVLARAVAGAGDVDLDRRAFRKNPPAGDITATQTLLREASVEALSVFAGYQIAPRAGLADALAHRFPQHLGGEALREREPERLLAPGVHTATPRRPAHDADLGL
jgi:hypothetical protein